MTAEQVAEHLGAKRAGAARWMAKCPAHPDRMPSLSIGTGADGRTLLNCHAGCSVDGILSASGLSRRDLFAGPPLSKGQIDELAAKRQAEEEKKSAERAMIRSTEHLAIGQLRQLDLAVNFLGGQLMFHPDDDSLALSFDQVLQELRRVESIASHLGILCGSGPWIEPPAFIDRYNPMREVAQMFIGANSILTREREALAERGPV
jgi:hypothetical protein